MVKMIANLLAFASVWRCSGTKVKFPAPSTLDGGSEQLSSHALAF